MKNEVKWFCEHAHSLEKFSGQCVVFHPHHDRIDVLKTTLSSRDHQEKKYVFHVPSKKELSSPLLIARKK